MTPRSASIAAAALLLTACNADGAPADDGGQSPAPERSESASPAPTAAAGEPAQAAIWGTWEVTQARLSDPDGAVQAYGDAELAALAGLRLEFTSASARWINPQVDGGESEYSAFRMACDDPRVEPGDATDKLVITCGDGRAFGPPVDAAADQPQLTGDNRLTLRWFDGITLELRRAS
ncbi:hypothetical protein [Aurantiacibacter suaedae]|uniref:hypothetical protein n=1 Tax=Aurantiacibacter suaedae TaxID=2545755 RepID=UPI0010FA16E0|nr:hypothetical protein [Aurantiacibacter suaedae]